MGSTTNIHKLLENLRDVPVDTEHVSGDILATLYNHLMNVPSASDNVLHWFCHRATRDTVETATFLIRMFAYESVDRWREKYHSCASQCPDCVQELERVKVTSRDT